jgi:rod shape determining protein RodA
MAVDYAGRSEVAGRRFDAAEIAALVRRLDWILLGAVGALVAYGLYAIAGITRWDIEGNSSYYVTRQAVYAAVGAVGLLGLSVLDPDVLRRLRRYLYGGSVVLLLLVLLPIGTEVRGSQRWLSLGPVTFQPSELVKLALVLALAGFLTDRLKQLNEWRTVLGAVGLALILILLVFAQPDIGTALVIAAATGGVLFVAGARWFHLAVLGAAAAFVAASVVWLLPSAGIEVLEPYQSDRLTTFLNPEENPRGEGYNVQQSKTAIGAGGLRGRGVEGATQTNLDYLPEHATDFAFASLAEQRGFVGASILLLLYLLVVWRGLRACSLAVNAFGAIVAGGIVVALLFQIFVNVGMTMGIAPVTGIPLPFVSVGGTAMIANLLAVGVLQAIQAQGVGNDRTARRR